MSSFAVFWGTLLVLSALLSVVLGLFITMWSWKVLNSMRSNPDWGGKNKIAKFILIILFGPLTFASFLAMIWLDRYPPPTITIVMFSIAIVAFGYILFIRKRKEGEARDWRTWSVMLVFISSVFLLLSLTCVTRGAALKLQSRSAFHGAAAILGYELENAADDGQKESLVQGTMQLVWDCGDFVCLNSSIFYCTDTEIDLLGESEVVADTAYQTKYHINSGYSPCGDNVQDIGEYDPNVNLQASGHPYVYVHGKCTSADECPVLVDPLPINLQSSLYSDEELHNYLQDKYWARADNAGDIFEIQAFRLLMVAVVGLAIAWNTYYYLANAPQVITGDKAVELLPKPEVGDIEEIAQEFTIEKDGVCA